LEELEGPLDVVSGESVSCLAATQLLAPRIRLDDRRPVSQTPEWPALQRKYRTMPEEVLWMERTFAGPSRTVPQCLQ
jgi:hypothetical protein